MARKIAPAKNVTLILGGARSGKSRHAQNLASNFRRVTFIATAEARDSEMRAKIAKHRRERPAQWKTVEAPLEVAKAIRQEAGNADVLLVDCLTLFAANVMATKRSKGAPELEYFANHIAELKTAMRNSQASIIAVSNEVGGGIVPATRSGRVFRDLLGRINQEIAAFSDCVIWMVAGLPVIVKENGVMVGASRR